MFVISFGFFGESTIVYNVCQCDWAITDSTLEHINISLWIELKLTLVS